MKTVIARRFLISQEFHSFTLWWHRLATSVGSSALVDRMESGERSSNYINISENVYKMIGRWDMIQSIINEQKVLEAYKYFYLLPEKIINFYEKFPLSPLSPFHDKFKSVSVKNYQTAALSIWRKLGQKRKSLFDNEWRWRLWNLLHFPGWNLNQLFGRYVWHLLEQLLEEFKLWKSWLRTINKRSRKLRLYRYQVRPFEI